MNLVGIFTRMEKISVEYMYNALIQPDPPIDKNNNKLLKLKIPLRIKVFGWYLRKRVLTKDNFAKKKWHGSKKCVFLSPR
jgi:hypothetical protein